MQETIVKPVGTFKFFLRWKGKVYKIQVEVMDSDDTPNVLSREITFLIGTFKCFLRWKGKVYRIQAEVMDSDDTPNVLSREITFLLGILKPCFWTKPILRLKKILEGK